MSEIFDRFMRVFITELGGIESQDDSEFLVTGNSNTNAIYLYVPKTLEITLVRVSFTRNDGFTISDYQMNVNEGLADDTYNVFEYIFKNNDKILEVGGRLQISFKLNKKTLISDDVYIDKVISTPITCANVLRSISQSEDVELAQQLYDASLQAVETVEEALNTHRLNTENPHKVNATQVKLDATSESTVAEKFTEVEQDITDVNQNLTNSINQVKTNLGNHTNNFNNPHKVTATQVKMSDGTSTVEERITSAEGQINSNYESIIQNKSSLDSHISDTNNPHQTTGVTAKIEKSSTQTIKDYVDNGLTNTLQQAKDYSDTKQSSKTSFVYETLENFIENVKYTITDNIATLTKIIDEYGTEYPSSELQVGNVNIYLREENVPDYWLSKKEVEVTDVFGPLYFFLPLETEMNVDLTNYVTYNDYATSEKGGVVKVSAENGVKIDSEGQISLNPATDEEIQNQAGNKAITSSNLPNASQENKGVVKLSSSFEINESGDLDIPIVYVSNVISKISYNIAYNIYLTEEQHNKIISSYNMILNFEQETSSTRKQNFFLTKTGEIYDNSTGALISIQYGANVLGEVLGGGCFFAEYIISNKQLKYTKSYLPQALWRSGEKLGWKVFETISSSSYNFDLTLKTINNNSLFGSGNIDTSIPSISLDISTLEGTISDDDLNTLLNNDVVINKSSVIFDSSNITVNAIFYKTNTIKEGDNAVELVLSTISNEFGSGTNFPSYVYIIVDVVNKTYYANIYTFASRLTYDQYRIILQNDFNDNISDVYVSTINGESLLTNNINDIVTSIKLENEYVSNWVSDTTYTDYPYKATISESNITSTMVAEVIYGLTEAESGNYAPVCDTFDGGIYIYSKVNDSIIIPTVLVVK